MTAEVGQSHINEGFKKGKYGFLFLRGSVESSGAPESPTVLCSLDFYSLVLVQNLGLFCK